MRPASLPVKPETRLTGPASLPLKPEAQAEGMRVASVQLTLRASQQRWNAGHNAAASDRRGRCLRAPASNRRSPAHAGESPLCP
jgi:hypothetical protein